MKSNKNQLIIKLNLFKQSNKNGYNHIIHYIRLTMPAQPIVLLMNQLRILFITDIHLNFQNVKKLASWNQKNNLPIDLIIIGGDTGNCDQTKKSHNQEEQQSLVDSILSQIQQIFKCKMYFIPGNHDPLSHYKMGHQINENIISCHQARVSISEGLEIVGFGGSVPAYLDMNQTIETWTGYPFNSNAELTEYLEKKQLFSGSQEGKTQKIYLTHCGPFSYETSIDRNNPKKPIYGGADYFDELVEHENLLIYLHGHVHNSSRYVRVNKVSLINPGAFLYGNLGHIVLEKVKGKDKDSWVLRTVSFVNLCEDL